MGKRSADDPLGDKPPVKVAKTDACNEADNKSTTNFKIYDSHSDVRIRKIQPLISPALLLEEMPVADAARTSIDKHRQGVSDILQGKDDRLVVVVGPCSIHDVDAAMDYATKLRQSAKELEDDLLIVMRVYFEKPRTTTGWKGLINDPFLDGSFQINKGLRLARQVLLDINTLGLPAGVEFLDTISPQFLADLVTWGAIGARTTECQLHRELASGMSMPIGFKNGTSGNVKIATDAVVAAKHPHCFLSVSTQGLSAIVTTKGNPDCHIILRGGDAGPNYDAHHVDQAVAQSKSSGLNGKVMVDCSHGNSKKIHTNQPLVAKDIGSQISAGNKDICGVMLESHVNGGNQKVIPNEELKYGVSITDACMDWDMTAAVLKELALAIRQKRESCQ